jgi:SMC interacting uncharacterized protein involved in chromosome segregation
MQLEMQVSQEKERRVFFEQSQKGGSDEKYLKKIGQLESKISEFRHNEVKFEAELKQMEEELESKDDQIDNLLANLENNELVEQMVKLSAEKDELEQELGTFV